MRVLIADDDPVSRRVLEAMLRKWDYHVVVASDGAQAWDLLQQEDAPRLAVFDWMMPGLTGPELCRLVRQREREPYTYILLLTSKSLKEDLIEGMNAGADDYVVKPFNQHELKVRLRAGRRIVELQAALLGAREELREQATRDSLTRLWNRSSILEILQHELARSEREGRPVGIVMADLDHFKAVNDTHGHAVGDAVLREAARRMQACMRCYDSLGRYGGEEFLTVLPGCDEANTTHYAERMRLAMRNEPIQTASYSAILTISFGATTANPGCAIGAEQLIRLADEALYQSKRSGRDRVTLASVHEEIAQPTLF